MKAKSAEIIVRRVEHTADDGPPAPVQHPNQNIMKVIVDSGDSVEPATLESLVHVVGDLLLAEWMGENLADFRKTALTPVRVAANTSAPQRERGGAA